MPTRVAVQDGETSSWRRPNLAWVLVVFVPPLLFAVVYLIVAVPRETVYAEVVQCDKNLSHPCVVTYSWHGNELREQLVLDFPLRPAVGDTGVPLWVDAAGRAPVLAGWRPLLNFVVVLLVMEVIWSGAVGLIGLLFSQDPPGARPPERSGPHPSGESSER